MKLDLATTPFSRFGSYLSLGLVNEGGARHLIVRRISMIEATWLVTKPPIHGWCLRKIMDANDLARRIARSFTDMVARSGGHYENYDALTGIGLRDQAYTWTASVNLLLLHQQQLESPAY